MMKQIIKEDLLHYVWKTKQVDVYNLQTIDNQVVEILDWGQPNNDAGPDFFNGKVRLDGIIWVGNIEMHVFSSDWEKHSHDSDPAYDNVILHVVYEEDKPAFTSKEYKLPSIEIKNRIDNHLKKNYTQLIQNNLSIPCKNLIHKVDEVIIKLWMDRLVAERLEYKSSQIKNVLSRYNNNWETTFYITLARYMGTKVNTEAFEALAHSLPPNVIYKNNDDLLKIEALLFGNAGMLSPSFKDEYLNALKKEYKFQKKKYSLKPIPPVMWKFAKMRPPNFPTVRIAQFAQLLFKNPLMFSKILEINTTKDYDLLFDVEASFYWNDHFRFGTISKKKSSKKLTKPFKDLITINVVAPTLFLYGLEKDDRKVCDKAISLLESIKPEKNSIISKWENLGVDSSSAMDTQALIHLKNEYCDKKNCLSCNIGNKIVKI